MSKSSGKWWEVGVLSHYTFSSEIKREDLPSGTKKKENVFIVERSVLLKKE